MKQISPRRLGSWLSTSEGIVVNWQRRIGAYTEVIYQCECPHLKFRGTKLKPVTCSSGKVRLYGSYLAT